MVKINQLEIENVKRIKAVQLTPSESGLTVIGGRNAQGKTSVLDSIAWALGGDRFRPSQPKREGANASPYLHITLSNGLVVERKGENSSLKVIDPDGNKGGQQLLNEFIEQLALNLPKFMNQSSKEKAETLLKIIGVGDELYRLENEETRIYNQRHAVGIVADQKAKYAKEMPVFPDVPKEPVSVSELIRRQQDILARNGENQRKRDKAYELQAERNRLAERVNNLKSELEKAQNQLIVADSEMETAFKTAEQLHDESTAELERDIADIESVNQKIRANLDREKAEIDAEGYKKEYDSLTDEIEAVRQAKRDLLKGADLPLDGLSVENGELTYNGFKWDNMSASEQLKVATAIVRKLNPNCGFVLIDKLEQMDTDTLKEFSEWLENQNLQAIATRVGTGEECSIIIDDGYSVRAETVFDNKPNWKAGKF